MTNFNGFDYLISGKTGFEKTASDINLAAAAELLEALDKMLAFSLEALEKMLAFSDERSARGLRTQEEASFAAEVSDIIAKARGLTP
jgi:hypothetical protein